jgi:hypothetical protein
MGAEPCSYNCALEAGSDVRSAPLMPNSASKKCWTPGLTVEMDTIEREGVILFSAGGKRKKKKKKKKSFLWFERERNREMEMRIFEF